MYLKQGLIKVEIAYCQGKTHADQRETLKKRQADLEMRRAMKR
jgi:SsrA-binding protein